MHHRLHNLQASMAKQQADMAKIMAALGNHNPSTITCTVADTTDRSYHWYHR